MAVSLIQTLTHTCCYLLCLGQEGVLVVVKLWYHKLLPQSLMTISLFSIGHFYKICVEMSTKTQLFGFLCDLLILFGLVFFKLMYYMSFIYILMLNMYQIYD